MIFFLQIDLANNVEQVESEIKSCPRNSGSPISLHILTAQILLTPYLIQSESYHHMVKDIPSINGNYGTLNVILWNNFNKAILDTGCNLCSM